MKMPLLSKESAFQPVGIACYLKMSTESWCLGFIMDTSHTDWLKKKKHMFYTQLAWEECKHYDFRPDIFK